MAKLDISPEAQSDLHSIKEYIATELENPSAALNTVSGITKAIRRLRTFPDMGAPLAAIVDIPNDYRFLVYGSYLVIYRHEGNTVFVLRVFYGRRDYLKILFGDAPEGGPEPTE